jgi:hypothetical protein
MTQHKYGPLTLQRRNIIDESGQNVALVFMPQYGDVLARSTHLEVACGAVRGLIEKEIAEFERFRGQALWFDDFIEKMRQMALVLRAAMEPQVPIKTAFQKTMDTAR